MTYVAGDVVVAVSVGIPRELDTRCAVAQPRIQVDRDVLYGAVRQDVVGRFGRSETKRGREIEYVDDRTEIQGAEVGALANEVRPAPELLMTQRTDQGLGDPVGQCANGFAIIDADRQRHHIGDHARTIFQRRSRACRDRQ